MKNITKMTAQQQQMLHKRKIRKYCYAKCSQLRFPLLKLITKISKDQISEKKDKHCNGI